MDKSYKILIGVSVAGIIMFLILNNKKQPVIQPTGGSTEPVVTQGATVDYSQCVSLGGNSYKYNGNVYTITSANCGGNFVVICWHCVDSNGNTCNLINTPM